MLSQAMADLQSWEKIVVAAVVGLVRLTEQRVLLPEPSENSLLLLVPGSRGPGELHRGCPCWETELRLMFGGISGELSLECRGSLAQKCPLHCAF